MRTGSRTRSRANPDVEVYGACSNLCHEIIAAFHSPGAYLPSVLDDALIDLPLLSSNVRCDAAEHCHHFCG